MEHILADYGLEAHLEEMREWYDGYHFGDNDVYCPWDVINHVDRLCGDPDAEPQAYWVDTSGNDLVKRFIDKANQISELDDKCNRALTQIHERRYDEYLRAEGRNDIWAYGIAFFKKRCKVVAEKL